ncbi:MAG: DUF1127 domain-containing protein [Geminicoccaceae bacterium]
MAAHVITSTDLEALGGRDDRRTPAAVSGLRAWFHDVGTRYRRHRLYRQTVAALAELDDRILADIGVGRHEIENVASAMSRKALR